MEIAHAGWKTRERVSQLETGSTELRSDVGTLAQEVSGFGGKIDKLVGEVTNDDESAARRAHAVKVEMREETDRRSRTWFALITAGGALLGAISIIVAALTGPGREKLETTPTGQVADTAGVAAVREILAQQGAAIGRDDDSIDLNRNKNRSQDDLLRQL